MYVMKDFSPSASNIHGEQFQTISMIWFCEINLLFVWLIIKEIITREKIIMIINKMNKKWSWKKGKFSIIGEFASCKIINNQVEICKKNK